MASKKEVEVPEPVTDTIDSLNKLFHVNEVEAANIDDVSDLAALFEGQGGLLEFKGSVFDVIDKSELVGKPFTIVDIRFYTGSYGETCAVLALTEDKRKVVFNDGSTGVLQQCKAAVSRAGRRGGFVCPKGLRASSYTWTLRDFDGNPVGEPKKATTYYIA
jgi:hypothetical protein